MEIRDATSPRFVRGATTDDLRHHYLVAGLIAQDEVRLTYSHEDRLTIGGAVPVSRSLLLEPQGPINRSAFLSGREIGILHIGGGPGTVEVDGFRHAMSPRDMLYVGRGERKLAFVSDDTAEPARFYFASATAHRNCPDRLIRADEVAPVEIGTAEGSSRRSLYRVIHPDHVETCELLMGYTVLVPGDTWNTMPPHLHDRRTEVYFYFDLPPAERVFHFLGQPAETRHLIVSNEQAVISPPWSIHAGVGTASYTFCWAMAGENCDYGDLDPVKTTELV